MTRTAIEWADEVWNPSTGCDRVSDGCTNCYAAPLARRWKAAGAAKYQRDGDPRTSGPGFGITEHPDVLAIPASWRRPRRIFVNSMSDLFHPGVTDSFLERTFEVMEQAGRHTFLVLTKRPPRMRAFLRARQARRTAGPAPNVWLGVSVENQEVADRRIGLLAGTPAAVRWISAEPLLGPLDLTAHLNPAPDAGPGSGAVLDWVVVGGESGPGAREMQPGWACSVRDQAAAAGVPLFFKQAGTQLARRWGCASRKGSDPAEWPEPFPREFPRPAHHHESEDRA